RDMTHAGQVLDRVAQAGKDDVIVSGLHFTIESPDPLTKKARDDAWNKAYEKATQIARLAGVRLGPPTSIREASPGRPILYGRTVWLSEVAGGGAGGVPTPIEQGELRVDVDLEVDFAILGSAEPSPATERPAAPGR